MLGIAQVPANIGRNTMTPRNKKGIGFNKRRRSRQDRSRELETSRGRKYRISELIQTHRKSSTSQYDQVRSREYKHEGIRTFEHEDMPTPETLNIHQDDDNLVIFKRASDNLNWSQDYMTSGVRTSSVTPLRRKMQSGKHTI